uniref:Eukaryotic translation initiation factor 4C n=1 Tax=Taeniopygia guttata TaxID=59729 RepID=H0ZAY5_TAEGU
MPHLNLLSFNLNPLLRVPSLRTPVNSLAPSFLAGTVGMKELSLTALAPGAVLCRGAAGARTARSCTSFSLSSATGRRAVPRRGPSPGYSRGHSRGHCRGHSRGHSRGRAGPGRGAGPGRALRRWSPPGRGGALWPGRRSGRSAAHEPAQPRPRRWSRPEPPPSPNRRPRPEPLPPPLPQLLRGGAFGAMPKNKGKGGKNRRRGKNENESEKRELVFKEDGQEYAQVIKMLGNGRLEALCFDGVKRLCHIRGKLRKKVWINTSDIILIGLRDYQDNKADVILKYNADEARSLKAYGELPEHAKINETDTFGPGDDDEIQFDDIGDDDEDIDDI